MDDSRVLPFAQRTGGREPPEGGDDAETVAPGNAYAITRGPRSGALLRFLGGDGRTFAMPYGYRPIVWGESPGLVLLEYPGFFTVILAGHHLGELEARLCEYRVAWIRECSDAQAAEMPTAVTRIRRMARYPSREEDGDA